MSTNKKLIRPMQGRRIAGFCQGLAEYFELDPVLVRLAYCALTIFSACFPGVFLYILAIIVVPSETAGNNPGNGNAANSTNNQCDVKSEHSNNYQR